MGDPAHRSRWFSPRLWVSLAVTAAWLAAMAGIWAREGRRGGGGLREVGLTPEELLVTWSGYDHQLWILQQGRRIGATRLSIQRQEDSKVPTGQMPDYELTSRTRLTLRLLGLATPVDLSLDALLNASFELRSFRGQATFAGQRLRLHAFTEGKSLYYRTTIGADAPSTGTRRAAPALLPPRDLCGRAPLAHPIVLRDALLPLIAKRANFQPGQEWSTQASMPLQGALGEPVRVRVIGREQLTLGGEPIDAWHLVEEVGEMRSDVYYGLNGALLRRVLPSGFVMERTSPDDLRHFDAAFAVLQPMGEIDTDYIRTHLDPALDGKPLESLLPIPPML